MTFGEKLKKARKGACLTQEQLAEKLIVSRQAITKWESNKGMPDIENLKGISKLLNVSVDYLLDDGNFFDKSVIREEIDLSKYHKEGKIRCLQDAVVYERYKGAEVYPLITKQKYTKGERIIDTIIGIFTDAPFGLPELIHDIDNIKNHYYLVNKEEKQFFVLVTNEFMESCEISNLITDKKFERGNMIFKKCNYKIEK